MMILPRYLFRQYLPVFLLCLGVCTGVLLMNQFMRLFNMALMKGISPLWLLSCFAGLLPYFLSLALPIAFLVALLLTLGGVSERGEIVALRSSGFSFAEILWPFFALALGLSVLLLYVDHKASPEGFHSFKNHYEGALSEVSHVDLEPGTFTQFGDWKLYAQGVAKDGSGLNGVYLVKLKGSHSGLRIEAPRGELTLEKGRGLWLTLYRGLMHMPEVTPARLISATFGAYRLFIPLVQAAGAPRNLDLQELNTPRLRDRLRDPSLDYYHRMEYTTEEAVRSAGALTPFVFFWLGCPLGLQLERHARATGFALSLVVLFLYYGILVFGIGLGRRHLALSPVGPWLPVMAGLAAGALIWHRRLRQ